MATCDKIQAEMPRKNEFVDTADALRPCLSAEPIYACTKATYGVGIDEISKCARVNQPDVKHKAQSMRSISEENVGLHGMQAALT